MHESTIRHLLRPSVMIDAIIDKLHTHILDDLINRPSPFKVFKDVDTGKTLKKIDDRAEGFLRERFIDFSRSIGGEDIQIVGEESRSSYRDDSSDISVLFDAIDGTDLFEKKMGNWCTAIVVFNNTSKNILGSFVSFPKQSTFFAIDEDIAEGADFLHTTGKYDMQDKNIIGDLENGTNDDVSLENSSICMYGQKFSRIDLLSSIVSEDKTKQWIQNNSGSARFYNLAGNPMMVKMAESDIDIVFELSGQDPHDVVPGTYIASKSGATLVDLSGNKITSDVMINPDTSGLKYILAANEELAREFINVFVEPNFE